MIFLRNNRLNFLRSALLWIGVVLLSPMAPLGAKPDNFHRVDDKVWRSAQPEKRDFPELRKLGIKEVLSLREWHDDARKAENTALQLHQVAMDAGDPREKDLLQAVKILRDSQGPILVHCWHGSDRTGTVVALYRMAINGWTRERAIAEFITPAYGYHAKTYPQLRRFLENVDIGKVKKALETK
jgi:tyrosine-protein phosphatase SIW14